MTCNNLYQCSSCNIRYSAPRHEGEDPLVFLIQADKPRFKLITSDQATQTCEFNNLACIHCVMAAKLPGINTNLIKQAVKDSENTTHLASFMNDYVSRVRFTNKLFLKDSFLFKNSTKSLQKRAIACFNNLPPKNQRLANIAITLTDLFFLIFTAGSFLYGLAVGVDSFRSLGNRFAVRKNPLRLLPITILAGSIGSVASTAFLFLSTLILNKVYPHIVEKSVAYAEGQQNK